MVMTLNISNFHWFNFVVLILPRFDVPGLIVPITPLLRSLMIPIADAQKVRRGGRTLTAINGMVALVYIVASASLGQVVSAELMVSMGILLLHRLDDVRVHCVLVIGH